MGISLWWVNMIDRRVGDEKISRVILDWAEIWPNERTNINFHIVEKFSWGWWYPWWWSPWWGSAFIGGDWIFSGGWEAYFNYSWFPDLSRAIRVKIVYQVYWDTTATDVNNLSWAFYYGNNQKVKLESYIVKRGSWNNYWLELAQGTGWQARQLSANPDSWNYTFTWDIKLTPITKYGTTYPWNMSRTLSDEEWTQIATNTWQIFYQEFIDNLHAANDFKLMLQPWVVVKSIDMYIYNAWTTPWWDWWHIPDVYEMNEIGTFFQFYLNQELDPLCNYFHFPITGRINPDWSYNATNRELRFWSKTTRGRSWTFRQPDFWDWYYGWANGDPGYWLNIRLFKDIPEIPDSSDPNWVCHVDVQSHRWQLRWNQTEWIISFTYNRGSNWYTIQDKNRWATEVWSEWDPVTPTNRGSFFQWWNNHPFELGFIGDVLWDTVDVSWYWDGIYYESPQFVAGQRYGIWFDPLDTPLWF